MVRVVCRWSAAALLSVLVLGGCGDSDGPAGGENGTTPGTPSALGTWQITVPGLEDGSFELRLRSLEAAAEEGTWLGVGCMGRGKGGLMAPAGIRLSEQASGGYDVVVTATLEIDPTTGGASVAQFSGPVDLQGPEIGDDEVGGPEALLRLQGREFSGWSGLHEARESEECPPVDAAGPSLSVTHNLEAHIDIGGGERTESAYFVTETNIVSAGVRVTLPGSGTLVLESRTDIFTPWVDFVESFRFSGSLEGLPRRGEPYGFALLDPAGDPIAGSEWEDVWDRCEVEAPDEVALEVMADGSLRVTWTPPPTVFGFDPEAGIGFYQLQVRSASGETVVGAETTQPEHVLPWSDFGGEAPGVPAGTSYGSGLEDLEAGTYLVVVAAYAGDANEPFASTACRVEDRDAAGSFTKQEDRLILG